MNQKIKFRRVRLIDANNAIFVPPGTKKKPMGYSTSDKTQ